MREKIFSCYTLEKRKNDDDFVMDLVTLSCASVPALPQLLHARLCKLEWSETSPLRFTAVGHFHAL